uniref:Uncharacterized protein n=1 Tax=Pseudictyota dubia TaxID=2749911 RepID=A0A7R9W5Z6_9STRA
MPFVGLENHPRPTKLKASNQRSLGNTLDADGLLNAYQSVFNTCLSILGKDQCKSLLQCITFCIVGDSCFKTGSMHFFSIWWLEKLFISSSESDTEPISLSKCTLRASLLRNPTFNAEARDFESIS